MDLKEYLKIFKKHIGVVLITVVAIVAGTFVYFATKPISYDNSLALNITRTGEQKTDAYRYDDYYRLQADDQFADTVVEWLKDPRTVANIYADAGIDASKFSMRQLSGSFDAEKLSSQIVSISFSTPNASQGRKISDAIVKEISKNTDMLNQSQNEESWFKIVAQDPVIVQWRIGPLIIFAASFLAGLFVAFWLVLIIHYLE